MHLGMVVALGLMLTGLAIAEPKRIFADDLRVDAQELARTLNLFLRDDDAATVDKSTNSVLIAEQPPEVAATIDALIDEIRPARDSGCCRQEAIPLLHADAEEVAKLVREYYEPDDCHIHAITRTNSVLVIARHELADAIKERIRAVDESQRPDYAVFVSAALLRVRLDDQTSSGADLLRRIIKLRLDGETVKLAEQYRQGSGGAIIQPRSLEWSENGELMNPLINALAEFENCELLSFPFVYVGDRQTGTLKFDQVTAEPARTLSLVSDSIMEKEHSDWERSRSVAITPQVQSDNELTLSVELHQQSANGSEKIEFSTSIWNRAIIVVSTGQSSSGEDSGIGIPLSDRLNYLQSQDKDRYEHILLLQAYIIKQSDDLIDQKIDEVASAIASEDSDEQDLESLFPDSVSEPAGETQLFLKRDLKHIPASTFLERAASAIARSRGLQLESPLERTKVEPEGSEAVLVGDAVLVADPNSNSLTISGSAEDFEIVESLADEVDVRPRQIYLSAVMAQIELDDDLRYGMDLLRTIDEIEVGGTVVDLLDLYRTSTGGNTILDLSRLDAALPAPSLSDYIEGLADQDDGRMKILARPHAVAAEKRSASISSRAASGLEVEVEPLAIEGDEMTLKITPTEEIDFTEVPNIGARSLWSKATLREGSILVIGGLLWEDDPRSEVLLFLQPTVVPASGGFGIWAEHHLPAGSREFDGDGDADGIPNGIEYVFGEREVITTAAGRLTAPPNVVPGDVVLSLEVSEDLRHWEEILRYESGRLVRQAEGVRIEEGIVIDESEPIGLDTSRFYRYRVSR